MQNRLRFKYGIESLICLINSGMELNICELSRLPKYIEINYNFKENTSSVVTIIRAETYHFSFLSGWIGPWTTTSNQRGILEALEGDVHAVWKLFDWKVGS